MTVETEKKRRIFYAGERLFLASGLHGVSLGEIAKSAQVPASLICHHYGTKEGLWFEVVKENFSRLDSLRSGLHSKEGTAIERLRDFLHGYHLGLAGDEKLRRLLLWLDLATCNSPGVDFMQDFKVGFALVAEAQAKGSLPPRHNPRQLFVMLLGIAEGPMYWREDYLTVVDGGPAGAVDAAYLRLIDGVLDGLQQMARKAD